MHNVKIHNSAYRLGSEMSVAEIYRATAAQFNAKACNETDAGMQKQWAILAQSYIRLAEQAERNAKAEVVYEPAWVTRREGEPT